MRQFGKVDIPQAAFIEALKMGIEGYCLTHYFPSWKRLFLIFVQPFWSPIGFSPMPRAYTVIFVGNYNPAIVSPAWLRANKAIPVDDDADPIINIIHPDVADFSISDIKFTIERNRFGIYSEVHGIEIIVTISQILFQNLLPQTPNKAVGLNFHEHVDFENFKKRNSLGRKLAPVDPWGDWGKNLDSEDVMSNGGMTSVSMRKVISVDPRILTTYTIEPSAPEKLREAHVFFAMNNHFEAPPTMLESGNHVEANDWLVVALAENFASREQEFDQLIAHMKGL